MTGDSNRTHVITVHGTFSGRAAYDDQADADREFFSEKSEFADKLKDALKDERPVAEWHEFEWNGKNLESERRRCSKKFTKYVKKIDLKPNDRLLVLAHSHGGNIALDGLRNAPVENPISLYTFGTPFIWKESRFFLSALAMLFPNFVFFAALMGLAAIIGLGHLQALLYGIPFIEIPRSAEVNAIFDAFNSRWAAPAATVVSVMAAFWLIFWPLKKSRYRARFKYLDVRRFSLKRIWRTDDEAIAMLMTEPRIAFPISIFNSTFLFVSAALFVGFVGWAVYDGLNQVREYRTNIDSSLSWSQVLPFGAEKIGLGLSVLFIMSLFYLVIQFLFRKPLTWLISRPFNNLLRKTSMGEDGYIRIDANHRPDMPRHFVTAYNESHPDIAEILEEVKSRSDNYLLKHRTTIMRTLAMGDGYLQDMLQQHDLTRSLIHTNYFTNAMAGFIAAEELKAPKANKAQTGVETAEKAES